MTPSATIVTSAMAIQIIVDEQGRRLTIRRLNALDRLRLFKAAGPFLAQNQPWLGMALVACSVAAIDDIPFPPPVSEPQIEAMIGRLGDAGIAAVASALHQPSEQSLAESVHNVGNLAGTPT
jgi:hypothetical protein